MMTDFRLMMRALRGGLPGLSFAVIVIGLIWLVAAILEGRP